MKRPLAYNSVVHYVCRCIKPTCRYLCRFHVSILHKIKLFTKPMVQTMMIIILIMSQKVSTLGFASKVILRVPLIGAVTTYPSGAPEFIPSLFQWGSCCSICSFLRRVYQIAVCPFSFWPLCSLSFLNLRIYIIPLVSSISSLQLSKMHQKRN